MRPIIPTRLTRCARECSFCERVSSAYSRARITHAYAPPRGLLKPVVVLSSQPRVLGSLFFFFLFPVFPFFFLSRAPRRAALRPPPNYYRCLPSAHNAPPWLLTSKTPAAFLRSLARSLARARATRNANSICNPLNSHQYWFMNTKNSRISTVDMIFARRRSFAFALATVPRPSLPLPLPLISPDRPVIDRFVE